MLICYQHFCLFLAMRKYLQRIELATYRRLFIVGDLPFGNLT